MEKKKKAAKYKTKCARLKKKMLKRNPQSPTTKTINILKGSNASSLVKKTLRFHFSLLSEIKARYSAAKKERVKQIYAWLICGKLIKKYKLQAFCQKQIGFSYKRWKTCGRELDFIRQKNIISQGLRSTVKQFFLRDDVSRVVTGKKNTVTVRKIKKQRRILCDTMVHLHKKFTAEHKHVSYSFFCAQRPFWVTQPKEADRDTCLCKTHENLQYMADKLFSLGILTSKNLEEMADATVCDMTKKECAYGQCKECKMTTCSLFRSLQSKEVNLTQWSLEKISHENGCDSSTVTIKKEIAITEDELVT